MNGEVYKIQVRYVSTRNAKGNWTSYINGKKYHSPLALIEALTQLRKNWALIQEKCNLKWRWEFRPIHFNK